MLLGSSRVAYADPHADAAREFDDGRKRRDDRSFHAAIDAFERSLRLEPSIGAYLNEGYCYEQLSNPRESLVAYRKAAALAQERKDPRAADAADAIKKLLDGADYVILHASPDVTAAGAVVRLDDEAVSTTELDTELFRRGAEHTIVVSAPGHREARLAAHSRDRVLLVLGPSDAPAAPLRPSPPPPADTSTTWGWQKWTGLGVAGAGIVTAAIGAVVAVGYYAEQDDLKNDAESTCRVKACVTPTLAPTPTGQQYYNRASDLDSTALRRNVIVFGIAGALVAAGTYLFFTAPSRTELALRSLGERGLVGTF